MRQERQRVPVWEVYNGQIADMRREGNTLQEIGNKIGVTRERVRQILEEKYGTVRVLLLPEARVARLIGCSTSRLKELREQGILHPKHTSQFVLYDRDGIEKAMLALQRNCPHCGEPLPVQHPGKYCPKCKIEYPRNPYRFRNEEGKRKCREATRSWMKRHPEAQQKYKKGHYAKTRYLVIYGEVLPIGSIVKAIGCEKTQLILDNGVKIPVRHVTILDQTAY